MIQVCAHHVVCISVHTTLDFKLSKMVSVCMKHPSLLKPLTEQSFTDAQQMELLSILSVLGCREIPTPHHLRRLITEVVHYEYVMKPKEPL